MNQYMKGVLCTIIGGACWGISGTCGEYLCTYRGMDTRVLTDMRLLGAGIILCIFLACRERKKLQEFLHTPKALIHCIIFGVCGLMFTQFAYLTAISKTNAGTATVLQYLSAIIVLLVVCVKNRKLPVLRENIAIISCLLGTFLVATHGSFTSLYISKEGLLWDELAVLDGGKCILQLRGVRPFLSDKYDLTQHPNYKLTSDYDPKNTFDIEKYLNRKEKIHPADEFIVVDADSLPPA